jgi:hypothetical protein
MQGSISKLVIAFALAAFGTFGSAVAVDRPAPANPGAFMGVHPATTANTPSCPTGFRLNTVDPGHFSCTSAPAACPTAFRLDNSSVRLQDGALTFDCFAPTKFPK